MVLDLDGYEGPIDLLLSLAREQKVDLAKISILALADQYLAFIAAQRQLQLEIAADYLVMAAWLAYLKSRLLLPQPPEDDEPEAAEMAAALGHRLKLLEAMQTAGRSADGAPAARPRFFSARRARRARDASRCRSGGSSSTSCCAPMATVAGAARTRCWRSSRRRFIRWTTRLQRFARFLGRVPEWRGIGALSAGRAARRADAPLGAGRDLCRGPRAGPRRPHRAAPGPRLRPDLSAQPPALRRAGEGAAG